MSNMRRLMGWCVVMVPWLVALYLHFWLVESEAWSPEQSYRGLMSVLLLALGMLISFYCMAVSRYVANHERPYVPHISTSDADESSQ